MFIADENSTKYCIIRGPEDNVNYAKSLVLGCIKDISAQNVMKTVDIPDDRLGLVIGAGGHHFRDISSKTGVRISINRKKQADKKIGEVC